MDASLTAALLALSLLPRLGLGADAPRWSLPAIDGTHGLLAVRYDALDPEAIPPESVTHHVWKGVVNSAFVSFDPAAGATVAGLWAAVRERYGARLEDASFDGSLGSARITIGGRACALHVYGHTARRSEDGRPQGRDEVYLELLDAEVYPRDVAQTRERAAIMAIPVR